MKSVLIISNNFDFCKEMNNNMLEEAKIVNISTSYEEGVVNTIRTKPDIVILETEVQYYKVVYLMKEIENLRLYNPTVIIITSSNLYDIMDKHPNCSVIKRKSKNYLMLYKIFKCIEEDVPDDILENKIRAEMFKVGFEMKNKGDFFILYVLKYIKTHESVGTKLEKEIYPNISQTINIPERQIKWNINYSIQSVYETKAHQLCKYLNIDVIQKPTTKYVIFTIVNNI